MVVSSKASSWRQPRPRSKRVKLLAARKSNFSSRHFWGRPEKHEHARDGVGEVAPISAHYFRFLYGTSRNAVTPCPTKDIQIHETTHPGLGRRALPIPVDESSFCLGKRVSSNRTKVSLAWDREKRLRRQRPVLLERELQRCDPYREEEIDLECVGRLCGKNGPPILVHRR